MLKQIKQITALSACLICFGFSSITHEFNWTDINTREVIRWDGDTAIIEQGSSAQELSCKIQLIQKEIDFAIESFGIPEQWTTISYRGEEDLKAKQITLENKARLHGIKMLGKENQFIVDYAWVIQKSKPHVKDAARQIRNAARKLGYRSKRELVGAIASFAQSLQYRIPSDHRINDEGEKILTAGALMPLDSLSKKWGDCDSKCLLFASLLRSIDLADVCFIIIDDHLFAGVQLVPEQDDYTVHHRGKEWVLVEASDAWPLGRIPLNHHTGIIKGKYTIVDLP